MNGQPPNDPHALTKFLRLLWGMMLASVLTYWFATEFLSRQQLEPRSLDELLGVGLTAAACVTAVGVLFLRFSLLPQARDRIQLRKFYIITYTLAETVALFGFVLRYLGAGEVQAGVLLGGSLVLFALCYPSVPPETPAV